MMAWLKRLNYIVNNYDTDKIDMLDRLRACDLRIKDGVNIIKERTSIHADVNFNSRDDSQIIMIGRYRNNDYIQTFSVNRGDFEGLLEQLRQMEKYGVVRHVDTVPMMKAHIMNDLEHWRDDA